MQEFWNRIIQISWIATFAIVAIYIYLDVKVTTKENQDQLHQLLSRYSPVEENQNPLEKHFAKLQEERKSKKNVKDYVPSGSFTRAVLMTGFHSSSNREPIILRITDTGVFGKSMGTEQIKEATLIGECYSDLSNEIASCQLETLKLENFKGEFIERDVKGWIVGEDGKNGIKGRVVDSGRKVDVVFQHGVDLNGVFTDLAPTTTTQTIHKVLGELDENNKRGKQDE